jgi:adenylate cyclase
LGRRVTRLRDLVRFETKRGFELPPWLERIVSAGIVSADPQIIRRQRITNVTALAGSLNACTRIFANFFYDSENFLLMQVTYAGLAIFPLLLHRLHRFGDIAAPAALTIWFLVAVTASSTFYGLQAQTQVYFLLAAIVWFVFGLENWRLCIGGLLLTCAVMLAVVNFVPQQGIAIVADERAVKFLAIQSMINAIVINAGVLFYALFLLRRAEDGLERQQARADALVSVVLPEAVARRLRSGTETRIADRIDNVSVLFADLVGFTPAAHEEPPEVVVEYLDQFVRTFDLMCETYDIDKIKTIGDSYMAVGGLQGGSTGGVIGIGRLAVEMLKAQHRRAPLGRRKLELRVGIHYGNAIAGVIGDTRISYDIWGDAVNMASRMQSHGVPGRIQVSEEYRAAAGSRFEFEERGDTEIKGIGVTRTYFLLGPREAI